MWFHIFLIIMIIFSFIFVEGSLYFKLYNFFICCMIGYIYTIISSIYITINKVLGHLESVSSLLGILKNRKENNVNDRTN